MLSLLHSKLLLTILTPDLHSLGMTYEEEDVHVPHRVPPVPRAQVCIQV